ncbi:MAG: preprotein translocase subunit SecA [Clostridia bacterium]|nr:preprotein translocase subunit SecA [Clostridia bacterium]
MKLIDKIFGTYSQREIKKLKKTVDLIESKEEAFKAKTDDELAAITPELKERYQNGETLDDLLPDAFAAVREAADRALGKRPFRVQLIGGIILHQGRIAEMKTGEGKTLVATLPAYLNALTGKGVHIVTVNDYLARCGAEEMGRVFAFLGMTTGLVVHGQYKDEKQKAYQADITYGTNNEFGFDYLRDNMVVYKNQMVQRGHSFAIVDEVDSVLIDEARTPLIISGEGDKSTDLYEKADRFASGLRVFVIKELDDKESHDDIDADYIVDEKAKTATLTASGVEKAERFFGLENLSDPENATIAHQINQAIRAHGIMKKEVDYIVKDDQVIIVDTFTGRLMPGRRYNEGLHQAIEAKEKVKVQKENKTLATVTFQNYFRMYEKLSGMTGTALTEEMEFREIYGLDVVEVPTNKPMIRTDHPDRVYKNLAGKYRAIVAQIEECHEKGQPVLVGTISIDKSELISRMLKTRGIPHTVLNAKYHEREAEIVAQAGKLGAVTISTNMAGRGTDIMLGGNAEFLAKAEMRKRGYDEETVSAATSFSHTDDEEILAARKTFRELKNKFAEEIRPEAEKVCSLGGLFILGTERHESRRIDNQLRGRSGRQGDPGESRFFLSLEDDLLRLFGSDRIMTMVERFGMDEDTPIDARILSGSIENAQKRIEGENFQRRKNVLEYDDVMNQQRQIIYKQRGEVLDGMDLSPKIRDMIEGSVSGAVAAATASENKADWNFDLLLEKFGGWLCRSDDFPSSEEERASLDPESIRTMLLDRAETLYRQKAELFGGEEVVRELERIVLLRAVDEKWMDHLEAMDDLRSGISLNAYAQRNPLTEYRITGADMFDEMVADIRETTVRTFLTAVPRKNVKIERKQVANPLIEGFAGGKPARRPASAQKKVGRNDPCPCGSGKKYKKCCGANASEAEN